MKQKKMKMLMQIIKKIYLKEILAVKIIKMKKKVKMKKYL